ncbi:hypothetical protein T5B8_15895 [Salinisphaera sp. T5B8]|uniref:ATP-binding protein n=1 Tax=Salinisphaera sp. T5B8 TaxID=1304154 RepID=UPI00333F814B
MAIKPWREIARPRTDVLKGNFSQSEFAADLSQVVKGEASPEYNDAATFFERTFITEGMRLLLTSLVQRLAGDNGDPVIQLQTAFGGGKTHTLLAVYHLATRDVSTDALPGIPPLLDAADVTELPRASVAVLDGNQHSPSKPHGYDTTSVNTLWGDLAYQLAGEQGFALIEDADKDGTSPGKQALSELIRMAAPCVILIDELVAYIRQFEPGRNYVGGTFDSNLSFVQALTEAVKTVPNAILLASLPESEVEVGGVRGQQALEALEKYFGRVESVWKPVGSEEAFEIVRRRLFEETADEEAIHAVCRAYADFYREHADQLPPETQERHYLERLYQSYPVHPEIFDRLYEDWSTLGKFQRTRGVLQLMAVVIHQLWNTNNRDVLIMPGSLPLDDTNVRNKSLHYLPQGWEAVIEAEVDGPRSQTAEVDGQDTRFGSIQAARRAARTIFLGSAPSTSAQDIRGINVHRILLGCLEPGQTPAVYLDVLRRLRDRLQYLFAEQDRFWFDTRPNLRREMEGRKGGFSDLEDVFPLLRGRLSRLFGKGNCFGGIHVFTPSADVPDDYGKGPRLVVLPYQDGYSRAEPSRAQAAAEEILRNRGDQPRQKQNRLLFLAADYDAVSRLKEQARTQLAWNSIVNDVNQDRITLDNRQAKQAKQQLDRADDVLKQLLRDAYKWILCPSGRSNSKHVEWEAVTVSSTAPNLIGEIETKVQEEEWLARDWSPFHLKRVLDAWYFKDGKPDVSAAKVWQDTCQFLFLPRLINDSVFRRAIEDGLASRDYFGFARGKEGDEYYGFAFDEPAIIHLDEDCLLIEREAAVAYATAIAPAPEPALAPQPGGGPQPSPGDGGSDPAPPPPHSGPSPAQAAATQFYGSVALDSVKAKMDFATIVDEVIEQFSMDPNADVTISVDITARSDKGFGEATQRAVRENCNTLRFSTAEFEGND